MERTCHNFFVHTCFFGFPLYQKQEITVWFMLKMCIFSFIQMLQLVEIACEDAHRHLTRGHFPLIVLLGHFWESIPVCWIGPLVL